MAMAVLESPVPAPFPFSLSFQCPRKKRKGNPKAHAERVDSKTTTIKLQHKENAISNNVDYSGNISTMLQSCRDLEKLKQIHGNVVKRGRGQKIPVAAKLIDLYATFGKVGDARVCFNELETSNRLVWNTAIKVCANNGLFQETLGLFYKMQSEGIKPNKFTFPFVIKACAGLLDLQGGREIHELVRNNGLESDAYIGPALVNMYAKCGCIKDARQVFDNISERNLVLLATMICRYVEAGDGYAALGLFREMMQLDGIGLDFGCFAGGLRACGHIRALLPDLFIWNTMISACAKNGYAMRALELFFEMKETGIEPSSFTFANVIPAFAHLGNLEQAMWIHECVSRKGFVSDTYVGTALVDMYAKCGNVEIARGVFDKLPRRNGATWIAMIAGYRINGQGEHAQALFNEMQKASVKPDYKTSIGFLSQADLVDGDCQYSDDRTTKFSIEPAVKHFARKVDLLGRAGRFEEACDFIRKMKLEDLASVWGTLLATCRIHCNTELAEYVAEKLFNLEPKNPKWYQLLSDVYTAAGRIDDLVKVKKMMRERMLTTAPRTAAGRIDGLVKVKKMIRERMLTTAPRRKLS